MLYYLNSNLQETIFLIFTEEVQNMLSTTVGRHLHSEFSQIEDWMLTSELTL